MYIKREYNNFNSLEEEKHYFERYKSGDLKAKNIIIEAYIGLVFGIVNTEFKCTSFEKDDLICVGIEGLIRSVNTFDLSKNILFYSYAKTCILNQINYYIRGSKKHLGIDSLDRVIVLDGVEQFKLQDTIIDENINIENEYIDNSLISEALNIISNLPDRERKIICMAYGVCGYERGTQSDIAREFGITQAGVSRLISKTLLKIRNIINGEENFIKKTKRKRLTSK